MCYYSQNTSNLRFLFVVGNLAGRDNPLVRESYARCVEQFIRNGIIPAMANRVTLDAVKAHIVY